MLSTSKEKDQVYIWQKYIISFYDIYLISESFSLGLFIVTNFNSKRVKANMKTIPVKLKWSFPKFQ